MKIINIKFNFKYVVIFICILITILSFIFLKKTLGGNELTLNTENYTSILKSVHDSPTEYVDKKIKMSGYVFRAKDFKENQFVVARDMIVLEGDYRIVGFLCESDEIKKYENNMWIEVTRNN